MNKKDPSSVNIQAIENLLENEDTISIGDKLDYCDRMIKMMNKNNHNFLSNSEGTKFITVTDFKKKKELILTKINMN